MTTAIALLVIFLSTVTVFLPLRAARQKAYQREFWEAVRVEQARVVRRHYPAAREMTIRELRDNYDISSAYHKIIRR